MIFWFLQSLIFLVFLLAFLQAFGFLRIKDSGLKKAWLYGALLYFLFIEFFIFVSSANRANKVILLIIIVLCLWVNFIKFSLGLIQEKEKSLFNRFEHFLAGVVLFYGFLLIDFAQFFSIQFHSFKARYFFIFLLANLALVIHENVELILDRIFKIKLFVGPGIYDTNVDLLMTFLGSLLALFCAAFICQVGWF